MRNLINSFINNIEDLGGFGILFLIFMVLFVLKIGGFVTMSWWWVAASLWIPIIIATITFSFIAIVMSIAYAGSELLNLLDGYKRG